MSLDAISTTVLWGAVTAYAVALVAFAVDLSRLADDPRRSRGTRAVGIALATTGAGAALHLGAVVTRGLAAGRAPWANLYEFTLAGTLSAVVAFLLVQRWRDLRYLGAPVVGIVVLFLGAALEVFYVTAQGAQPALQSYWLVVHVSIATIATGVLTVALVISVIQLAKHHRETGRGPLAGRGWRLLDAASDVTSLEAMSYRLNAVGFVLWTFTLIAGAIWAEHAWGRYWGWDPKEVWTLVIWVVYATYLHARTTRGWGGRRAAYFVLVGYACVIFNFTAVNFVFLSKHSYSGL